MTLPSLWDWYASVGYDALLTLIPYRALQEHVVDAAACQSGERVLVAGCGTGNFEAFALRRTPTLTIDAIDFSTSMLARARRKCRTCPQVRHQRADLCQPLPFDTASFDVAVMCNVLYALPDRQAALREIARVLKSNGRFILCDRPPHSHFGPVARAHVEALRARPLPARLGGWLRTAAVLPALGGVVAANARIQEYQRSGVYYFFSEEEIVSSLTTLGFTVDSIGPAYAKQCWLLQAQRACPEGSA